MRKFFKKIINYIVSLNNKQSHLLKEIVFNNLVQTKLEYVNNWETSAEESWHFRFFNH